MKIKRGGHMEPGTELDELIAVKVMGIHSKRVQVPCPDNEPGCCVLHTALNHPPYSISIAAAWEAVEKMEEHEHAFRYVKTKYEDGTIRHWAQFTSIALATQKVRTCMHEGKTAAHAICIAAIKAIEWRYEN